METEKPTGPVVKHWGSSGSGVRRNDTDNAGEMRPLDENPRVAPDVEISAEDSCEAQVKRAKTSMGLEICVLEAQDDEATETPTNLAETSGEDVTEEDVVAPEVTEELNRLTALGRPYRAPTVDELMPKVYVYSQKTNERLDDRMVAEGRERELSTLCSQDACTVRGPEDSTSPKHQNGPWQVR